MGIVGNVVDYVTIFGPAYNSGKIRQGDKITSVGGVDMDDDLDRIVSCIAPHEGSKALVRVAVLNTSNTEGEGSERQGAPVEVDLLRWPKTHMQLYQDLHDKIQDLAQQSAESAAIGVDLVNMLSAIKAWEYAEEVRLRQRVMHLDEGASDGKREGGEKTRDLEQEIFDLKKKLVEKDSLITDWQKLLKVEKDRIFQLEQELNDGTKEGGGQTRDLEQEIFDLKKKLVEVDTDIILESLDPLAGKPQRCVWTVVEVLSRPRK